MPLSMRMRSNRGAGGEAAGLAWASSQQRRTADLSLSVGDRSLCFGGYGFQ